MSLVSIFKASSPLLFRTLVRFIYEKTLSSLFCIIKGVAGGAAINPCPGDEAGIRLWALAEPWNQLNDLLQINFLFLWLNEYVGS